MQKKKLKYRFCAALLLCFLQTAGIGLHAQQTEKDTTTPDPAARRTIVVPANRSKSSTQKANATAGDTVTTSVSRLVVPANRSKSLAQESNEPADTTKTLTYKTIIVPAKRTVSSEQDVIAASVDTISIPEVITAPVDTPELLVQEDEITDDNNVESVADEQLAAAPIDTFLVDSLERVNQENMQYLSAEKAGEVVMDTIAAPTPAPEKKVWNPNPTRATWLAIVFPGGGQIYNRKYWKLPIVYGGFVGCAYALTWNNNMYKDYSQAYLDIMDKDPSTNSYYDVLNINVVIDEIEGTNVDRYASSLKRQKDYYRRYRDISVFAFIGVYLLSIIDAYVDAELSNFDIGPDISMRLEPAVINSSSNSLMNRSKIGGFKNNALGLQCSIRF